MVTEVRYLEIIIEEMLKTDRYVFEIWERVFKIMEAFRIQMKAGGGISFGIMLRVYKGAVEPILLCGAEF